MGKSSKDKRDIYYRQGKTEGYRARSAYKLLHLNEQYGFLGGASAYALEASASDSASVLGSTSTPKSRALKPTPRRVVDLCAAPGSWSQVISNRLSSLPDSRLVAVDLQSMAPLPGVVEIIGDITTSATALAVSRALGGQKAELVVCDGAPDVTGLHDLDEYLQSQLLLAATQITFRLLERGGTFVAKIFTSARNKNDPSSRSSSGDLLVAQLRTFFEKVEVSKPRSSRSNSVEHFIVCEGFLPPVGFDLCSDLTLVEFANLLKKVSDPEIDGRLTGVTKEGREMLKKVIPFVAGGDLSGFNE
ncbi:FtsJ-domain-containing protein [Violaceomyces palustris]|uniref:FtsJ-domain-containing protein n=1 Tax=Violaceomyces palustris TaxID=1673888 RepID=A0ACD0P440_9BASI|nr:FtsJ-domain-containing protein [Violaceomyces palustris]